MKILITAFALISIFHYGATLTCYFCTNSYGTNCITPNITTTRCHLHNDALNHQLTQFYGSNFVNTYVKSSEDIKCVHFERYMKMGNRTEVYRGCLHVRYAADYCKTQRLDQQYYPYNLTKCNICGKDMCNSSTHSKSSFIRLATSLIAMVLYAM